MAEERTRATILGERMEGGITDGRGEWLQIRNQIIAYALFHEPGLLDGLDATDHQSLHAYPDAYDIIIDPERQNAAELAIARARAEVIAHVVREEKDQPFSDQQLPGVMHIVLENLTRQRGRVDAIIEQMTLSSDNRWLDAYERIAKQAGNVEQTDILLRELANMVAGDELRHKRRNLPSELPRALEQALNGNVLARGG